ncbi:MAG TPA: ammonia-forming cytochrome c nitrite reductase subunit c552 [Bacteroidales bacterium]|nr:ammonia-forming cytochrome c nitrite reductase subunit c552 [Bacteroidales bacterium]
MKNLIKLFSVTVAAGFILASCEGPMGPAGKDGTNGTDANETCKQCHNGTVVESKAVEYSLSKHHTGEAEAEEAGNTGCAPCHSSEGFKFVCSNNIPSTFTLNSSTGKYGNDYATDASHAIGEFECNTCHSSLHTSYTETDFFPLTTTAAVPMTMWAGAKTINLTQDNGKSNLCIKCHQPRPFTKSNTDGNVIDYASLISNKTAIFYDSTTANMANNVLKVGYRTHTHYGTVGAICAGVGGIEFPGAASYTSSEHATVASCTDCHMADVSGKAGGHTFSAIGNFNGCNVTGCHANNPVTSSTPDKWTLPRNQIKTLLATLAGKLKQGGVEIMNKNGDATSNLWYGITTNNYDGYLNVFDPVNNPNGPTYNTSSFQNPTTTGWTSAQKATNAALPKLTLKNIQMGAIINFQLCLREYSLGIHNLNYSYALLQNTIDALTAAGF